jgi:hypothetical protein
MNMLDPLGYSCVGATAQRDNVASASDAHGAGMVVAVAATSGRITAAASSNQSKSGDQPSVVDIVLNAVKK